MYTHIYLHLKKKKECALQMKMMSEYLRSTVAGHQIKTDYIRIALLRFALFDAKARSFELPCLMRVDLRQCGIRRRFQDLDARGTLIGGAREREADQVLLISCMPLRRIKSQNKHHFTWTNTQQWHLKIKNISSPG